MLKKTITFDNFDGKSETKDFHFHLTKAELIEVVSKYPDDFSAYVNDIARANNKEELVSLFRTVILKSYGIKEGNSFKKTTELAEEFSHTEAYSELFMELFSSTDNLIAFFNSLLNVDIEKLAAEQTKK